MIAVRRRIAEEAGMRGTDWRQSAMFSYISAERRAPMDHPRLRDRQVTPHIARKRTSIIAARARMHHPLKYAL